MGLLWYSKPEKNHVGFIKHGKGRLDETLFVCDMCYENDVDRVLGDGWKHATVDTLREAREYCFICQCDYCKNVIGPEQPKEGR